MKKSSILLTLISLMVVLASGCEFDEFDDGGSCTICWHTYPGCMTCDAGGCNSCQEGLFLVEADVRLCVESCDLVNITTYTEPSKFFADNNAKKCKKCGENCANCVDDVGCTQCNVGAASTKTLITDSDGMKTCTSCKDAFSTDCEQCNATECTYCNGKSLVGGVCTDACTDPNCFDCNADKDTCNHCTTGYLFASGSTCESLTCTVGNCKNCTDDVVTTCDGCLEGFWLSDPSTCDACIDNCLECSDGTTCNTCAAGYVLSEDGSQCLTECSETQFVSTSTLTNPISGVFETKQCAQCNVTVCETCIGGDTSDCTKCALGKFLNVQDSTLMSGTCDDQAPYATDDDILIYVSNLETDYAKASNLHLGTETDPDISLVRAIARAKETAAQYSTKSGGDTLVVNIVLYKGDHYMLYEQLEPMISKIDFYGANYHLKITPLYCSLMGTPDTAICFDNATSTDQVNIYNKLGMLYMLDAPQKLTLERITFEMMDGFIPVPDDVDNCLTERKKCCTWDSSTMAITQVDPAQTETCEFRFPVSDFCHRASKYRFINMPPYASAYGSTSPPEVVMDYVTVNDVFFEMNSVIDFNIGGYVTITNSNFNRFSHCGAVIKNYYPNTYNYLTSSATYTEYMTHFNYRKNNLVTSDHDCSATASTLCFRLEVQNTGFTDFNHEKAIISGIGSTTNPANGVEHRGFIFHLQDFIGDIVTHGNTVTDVRTRITSCGITCVAGFFSSSEFISIYGTERTTASNYIFYIIGHEGDLILGADVQNVSTSAEQIKIEQGSQTPNSVVILNELSLTSAFSYTKGVGVEVVRYVDPAFESTDSATITSLLNTGASSPCSGVAVIDSTFNQISGCIVSGEIFLFKCLTSSGSIFSPSLTQAEIAALNNQNEDSYSLTIGGSTKTFDKSYLYFKGTTFSHVLGSPSSNTFLIEGYHKIHFEGNNFDNNGFYIESRMDEWSQFSQYHQSFFDSYGGFCNRFQSNPVYGFLTVKSSHQVKFVTTTVTNHFFHHSTESLAPTWAAFVSFSDTNGLVEFDGLTVTEMKGLLGTYNIDTMGTISALSSYGENVTSYQFIPVINTDLTNMIPELKISNAVFNDSVANLGGSLYGGFLLNSPLNSNTNNLDITKVTISNLQVNNVYIYNHGAIVYRYGDFALSDSAVDGYGQTQPLASSSVSTASPFINKIRADYFSEFRNLTFTNSVGGADGASLYIDSDTTISVTANAGNHYEVENMTISNSNSTNSLFKIKGTNLQGQVDGLDAQNNPSAVSGVVSISGGGTHNFNSANFYGNLGSIASDLSIQSCPLCSVSFTGSTFSRDAVDTSGTVTYDQPRAIYLSTGGSLAFESSNFSNYLLVDEGGVMKIAETSVTATNSEFRTNSAQTGGALYVESSSTITLTNTTFDGNSASVQSGVIFSRINCVVSSNNSTYSNNQAPTDAVLTCLQNSGFNDLGSTFTQNIATTKHCIGSISQGPGSVFDSSTFEQNSVTGTEGILIYNLFNDITLQGVTVRDNQFAGGVKNFKIVASLTNVIDSTFEVQNPGDVSAETAKGGFLNFISSTIFLTNSNFINGTADFGAAVYVSGSTFASAGCTFTGNKAKTGGGALYALTLSSFKTENDTFIDNEAGDGDAIGISNVNDFLQVINGTFQSSTPPQFIHAKYSSLNVEGSTFEQTDNFDQTSSSSLKDGSAIWIDSAVRITASGNTFLNLNSKNGAVMLAENEAALSIERLYPTQAANDVKLVDFSSNNFTNCHSYGDLGGGGIYYGCTLDGCQLNFNSDSFTNCTSQTVGGAINWVYDEPEGMDTLTFSNNSAAEYGDDVSAVPNKLKFVTEEYFTANTATRRRVLSSDPGDPYPNSTISDQRSGGALPDLFIGIFDKYDSLVKSADGASIRPAIVDNTAQEGITPFITESTAQASVNGLFNISGISTTGLPGGTIQLSFTTASIDETIPSNTAGGSSITIDVKLAACQVGEAFLDNGECQECQEGVGYLLEAPTSETTCTPCPISYAQCLGGSTIVPKAGYWRSSNMTDVFYECNNPDACIGYNAESHADLQGACLQGYTGILCGKCDVGYSNVGDFACGKCPNDVFNTIRIFGFFTLVAIIVIILVKVTINGANNKRNILGVYNRMLVNHLQMLVIIYSFDLEWPNNFVNMFKSAEPVAEAPQQFISFDCFLDQRTADNPDANSLPLYYYRVFIAAALPWGVLVLTYAVWNIIYLFYYFKEDPEKATNKQKYYATLSEQKKRRIVASNLIVLIFIHPSLLDVLFELFNCTEIDGKILMARELEETCYEGRHLYLTLFLATPSLLIWGFGVPFFSLVKVIQKRKVLQTDTVREEYGYLYNGYLKHAYYWESVIMYRKVGMVFLATVASLSGRKVQAMLVFALMVLVICMHNITKPFMTASLNRLESVSIFALTFSIFAGIFFVTDSSNNPTIMKTRNEFELSDMEKLIIYLFFLLSNILFFVMWGVLYIVEGRRFIRIRYPKLYHYMCLCNNKRAVEKEKNMHDFFIQNDELIDKYMELKDNLNICYKKIVQGKTNKIEHIFDSFKTVRDKLDQMRKDHKNDKKLMKDNKSKGKTNLERSSPMKTRKNLYALEEINPDFDYSVDNDSSGHFMSRTVSRSKSNKSGDFSAAGENKTQVELLNGGQTISDINRKNTTEFKQDLTNREDVIDRSHHMMLEEEKSNGALFFKANKNGNQDNIYYDEEEEEEVDKTI